MKKILILGIIAKKLNILQNFGMAKGFCFLKMIKIKNDDLKYWKI